MRTDTPDGNADEGRGFEAAAPDAVIASVAQRLRERNFEVMVVGDTDEAKRVVLERIPVGAEVHSGKSKTLEETGIFAALTDSGDYDALRPRYMKMDRATKGREIRKMIAAPDHMVGSVNAVTQDGVLVASSATGSQLAGYVYGAGKLILVVGSQKIVPDLETAMRRIREHVFPWEDERVRESLGTGTKLEKILLLEGEWQPERTLVVLVRQPVGV